MRNYQQHFKHSWCVICFQVWPTVTWVNFQYVPQQFRELFFSLVASCWCAPLTFLASLNNVSYIKFISTTQIQVITHEFFWQILRIFFFPCKLISQGYLHQFESWIRCNQEGLDGGSKGSNRSSDFQVAESKSWGKEGFKKLVSVLANLLPF